jgi:hypothetical protein
MSAYALYNNFLCFCCDALKNVVGFWELSRFLHDKKQKNFITFILD